MKSQTLLTNLHIHAHTFLVKALCVTYIGAQKLHCSIVTVNFLPRSENCPFALRNIHNFMGISSMCVLLFSAFTLLLFEFTHSAVIVVDEVSQWKNPQVQIGDSVVFQHKYHYSLYIFKNQGAFTLCNFGQATVLTKPDSTSYTWHVSRPGFFYFSFNNGTNKACLQGQKLAVEVSSPAPPPIPPSVETPPPVSGGIVASSPAYPWPFQPKESNSPSSAPALSASASSPMTADREGIPFINSNPAVPLPTGEIDSATIRPLTTSGDGHPKLVVGFWDLLRSLSRAILVIVMV